MSFPAIGLSFLNLNPLLSHFFKKYKHNSVAFGDANSFWREFVWGVFIC